MNKTLLAILALLLVGCAPQITNFDECVAAGNPVLESYPEQCNANGKTFVNTVSQIHDLPVPPAVDAAREYVMKKTGASKDEIVILEAHEREWSDSCLGLGGPAESCLQAITPGYEVKINAKGNEYVLRTDNSGEVIREESVTPAEEIITPGMKLVANIEDTPAIIAAREYLVEKYNVDEEKFLAIDVQEKEWTDGCLGLGGAAESCAAVITPGFQITLTDMDYDYVMRTDRDGNSVREESRTEVEDGILR